MREEFRSDLAQVSRTLVMMAETVRAAMRRATFALLKADQAEAEQVIDRDPEINALYRIVEDKVYVVGEVRAPGAPTSSPACGGGGPRGGGGGAVQARRTAPRPLRPFGPPPPHAVEDEAGC